LYLIINSLFSSSELHFLSSLITLDMERFKWPFKKDECQQSVQAVHRHVQTMQVLLISSNRWLLRPEASSSSKYADVGERSLLVQSSADVMQKLEVQYKAVLGLCSELAKSGEVIGEIADRVKILQDDCKGVRFKLRGYIDSEGRRD
jgi:hypothetical protein